MERKGKKEVKSLVGLDDLLDVCGRPRMLRFLAQVTVVLKPGSGSEEAGWRGRVGRLSSHLLTWCVHIWKWHLTEGLQMQEGICEALSYDKRSETISVTYSHLPTRQIFWSIYFDWDATRLATFCLVEPTL